jgi:hypothetical protein
MTEAAIVHPPQRVDSETIGSDRDRVGRHRVRQHCRCGILAFRQRPHRIATGENAS